MKALWGTAVAVIAAGALSFAAPASATTFCVPTFSEGCPDSNGNQAAASLQIALNTAGSDGSADIVRLAPGTHSRDGAFTAVGSDELTIVGTGRTETIITSTATTAGAVLNLYSGNTRKITVRDLQVVVPASFPNSGGVGSALIQSNDTIERVDIVSKNSQANGVTSIIQGGTFRDVRFFGRAGGRFGYALGNPAGDNCPNAPYTLVADDVSIQDSSMGITADCPKVEAKVTDVITRGVGTSIYLQGGCQDNDEERPVRER